MKSILNQVKKVPLKIILVIVASYYYSSLIKKDIYLLLLIIFTSNSREEATKELSYILKTMLFIRKSDNLSLIVKSSKFNYITDFIFLLIINLEASKLHPFEIDLLSTLRKLILSNFSSKDARSITLNNFNTF